MQSNWHYAGALNFYRYATNRDTIEEFVSPPGAPLPLDRRVYILYYPDNQDFIARNKLRIVYKGELSDVVVAIRP